MQYQGQGHSAINRKQAIAIKLSELRESGAKVHAKSSAAKKPRQKKPAPGIHYLTRKTAVKRR